MCPKDLPRRAVGQGSVGGTKGTEEVAGKTVDQYRDSLAATSSVPLQVDFD
jgi:hypothetical protein